jgi:hypothetical protein
MTKNHTREFHEEHFDYVISTGKEESANTYGTKPDKN